MKKGQTVLLNDALAAAYTAYRVNYGYIRIEDAISRTDSSGERYAVSWSNAELTKHALGYVSNVRYHRNIPQVTITKEDRENALCVKKYMTELTIKILTGKATPGESIVHRLSSQEFIDVRKEIIYIVGIPLMIAKYNVSKNRKKQN